MAAKDCFRGQEGTARDFVQMHHYSRPDDGRGDAAAAHCRGEERQQSRDDKGSWRKHRPFYVLSAKESSWLFPAVTTDAAPRGVSSSSGGRAFVRTAPPTAQLSHGNVRPHSRYAQHRHTWEQQQQQQRRPDTSPGTTCRPLVFVVDDTTEAALAQGGGPKKQGICDPPIVCMPEVTLEADATHARRKLFGDSWSFTSRERGLHAPPLSSSLSSGQPRTQLDTRSAVAPCVAGEATVHDTRHEFLADPPRSWSHPSSLRVTGSARSRIQPQGHHHRLMEMQKQSMAKLIYGIP